MSDLPRPQLTVHGVPVLFDDVSLLPAFTGNQYSSIHILTDENTTRHCRPALSGLSWKTPVHWIEFRAGEAYKSIDTCMHVWRDLARQGADRNSLVINLGGGVLTDLGGFCAATYMRGMPFAHVPTSVLAMADAAIGGKHGVDMDGLKNYVGVFASPVHVWIDPRFLKTLPARHVNNGLAEVIKHGCIHDPGLFDLLADGIPPGAREWNQLLLRSARAKQHFVESDPYERSIRAALNFGHTIGHALETFGLRNALDLLHGEAVAMGMIIESRISHELLELPQDQLEIIEKCIRKVFTHLKLPEISPDDLEALISRDKKSRSGQSQFALIRALGEPAIGVEVQPGVLERAMASYKNS